MARRPTDPKITIIGIPTNSSGNIDGVSRGPSAPRKKTVTRFLSYTFITHYTSITQVVYKCNVMNV
jgi:hypothetical protein